MSKPVISAHFEIRGFGCDPAVITAVVGTAPSQVWRKGDRSEPGSAERKCSGWRLVAPLLDDVELQPYAAWLLDRLPRTLDLAEVTEEWEAQVAFTVFADDEAPAMFFELPILRRIVALGATLDVDLYLGNHAD